MSKILYVSEVLHRKLKFLATKLGFTMQEATEEAVENWINQKDTEERQQELLINRIEQKLSEEEKKILEAILAKKKVK
jgi:seryl-tRNA(Sec) selenium transferase